MSRPGVGKWLVDSIFQRDYPAVQGGLLLTASLVVMAKLGVDLLNHQSASPKRVMAAPPLDPKTAETGGRKGEPPGPSAQF